MFEGWHGIHSCNRFWSGPRRVLAKGPVRGLVCFAAVFLWAGQHQGVLARAAVRCTSLRFSVHYLAGSSRVTGQAKARIASLKREFSSCQVRSLEIVGGRDSPGGSGEPLQARQRVEAVASALEAVGAPEASIVKSAATVGRPARTADRRVTVHIRFAGPG